MSQRQKSIGILPCSRWGRAVAGVIGPIAHAECAGTDRSSANLASRVRFSGSRLGPVDILAQGQEGAVDALAAPEPAEGAAN
jgi:hypothetical protein